MKKNTILFITMLGFMLHAVAQQVPLKGVVTVQNSKTYTGKTQYVKNAEVEHTNAKNAKTKDVTGDDGKFLLSIKGVELNTQTQIALTLHGEYGDYVVVNEKELRDITLGRLAPISVYVCKKGDLEQRQAEMVGINMRKLEERLEKDKNRLQKELNELRAKNDYLNVRYTEIKDSLNVISDNIDKAFERIKEYAKTMTLENLDDRDENYVKAYNCFSRGELDSVFHYLSEYELELKYQKVLQLQQEAQKEKELATILTESARQKEELSENTLNELTKEWLLLARTANMQNDYEKTQLYYGKILHADPTNTDIMLEFADYLQKIQEYEKAEPYYVQCLEINRTFVLENPNNYLPKLAKTLNSLGYVHYSKSDFVNASKAYKEALTIFRTLAEDEGSESTLSAVASILVNLGILHSDSKEHSMALPEFEEAFSIFKKLAEEHTNPDHLSGVAKTLLYIASSHMDLNELTSALQEFDESVKIFRELAAENPKHLHYLAVALQRRAVFHYYKRDYPLALQDNQDALQIYRALANENPKTYLSLLAGLLNNLATMRGDLEEYSTALSEYEESLKIRRELAAEQPVIFLPALANTLANYGRINRVLEKYQFALEQYEEALKIRRDFAAENPKAHNVYVAMLLTNLADLQSVTNKYSDAIQSYEESFKMFNEIYPVLPQGYLPFFAVSYADLSKCYLYNKEYTQTERYARMALDIDSNASIAKLNLAHALLFQNHLPEAENLYIELSKTVDEEGENYTKMIYDDFDAFEKAGIIPEERKMDVEKIKNTINN